MAFAGVFDQSMYTYVTQGSSHAGSKKYPEEGTKNVLKTAEKYDCSQFLQGGHNKKGGSSSNKSQIDIFPVLYSHFKYFFKQSSQCYWSCRFI